MFMFAGSAAFLRNGFLLARIIIEILIEFDTVMTTINILYSYVGTSHSDYHVEISHSDFYVGTSHSDYHI